MDFEAEALKLQNSLSLPWKEAVVEIADALRRAYEAGVADALVKRIDAAAGDAWEPVGQEGE